MLCPNTTLSPSVCLVAHCPAEYLKEKFLVSLTILPTLFQLYRKHGVSWNNVAIPNGH